MHEPFAFEPDSQNFSRLEFNLSPFGQVECFPVALSDSTGEATYFLDPDNSGNYSRNPAAMPEQHATGTVHCVNGASCKTSIAGYIFPHWPAKLEGAGGHFWHDAFSTTTS